MLPRDGAASIGLPLGGEISTGYVGGTQEIRRERSGFRFDAACVVLPKPRSELRVVRARAIVRYSHKSAEALIKPWRQLRQVPSGTNHCLRKKILGIAINSLINAMTHFICDLAWSMMR